MTMLVLPLVAENGHPNPSAKSLAIRLETGLGASIVRLSREVEAKGLFSLEGKIEASGQVEAGLPALYWLDKDVDEIPEGTKATALEELVSQHPGAASFPQVKVFLDGFSISAYDSHASEPTILETFKVPLSALEETDEEVIIL
jgi:hypothetical protein